MIKTVIKVCKGKQALTDLDMAMEVVDMISLQSVLGAVYKNMEYLYNGLWLCEMSSYPDQQFTAVNVNGFVYEISLKSTFIGSRQ
jgi:hypothetical protein